MNEEKIIRLLRAEETSCCKAISGDHSIPGSGVIDDCDVEHQEDGTSGP